MSAKPVDEAAQKAADVLADLMRDEPGVFVELFQAARLVAASRGTAVHEDYLTALERTTDTINTKVGPL